MEKIQRVIIVPYILGSNSAKLLKQYLGGHLPIPVLTVSKKSLKYQPRWTDYVINWGCSKEWHWINNTQKIGHTKCVNKLTFFQTIQQWNNEHAELQVNIPEWTTDKQVAKDWNKDYFARTILNGHSGAGIVAHLAGVDAINAPLYVQYKKKRHEYRVHFFKNKDGSYQVIDVTQKKKRKGAENLDTKIRNHKNGWVYAREGIVEPTDLREQAIRTAHAVGLDFGAVDLIWNEKENKSYVLEVNSAPGLVGTTLEQYCQAFLKDITK